MLSGGALIVHEVPDAHEMFSYFIDQLSKIFYKMLLSTPHNYELVMGGREKHFEDPII